MGGFSQQPSDRPLWTIRYYLVPVESPVNVDALAIEKAGVYDKFAAVGLISAPVDCVSSPPEVILIVDTVRFRLEEAMKWWSRFVLAYPVLCICIGARLF